VADRWSADQPDRVAGLTDWAAWSDRLTSPAGWFGWPDRVASRTECPKNLSPKISPRIRGAVSICPVLDCRHAENPHCGQHEEIDMRHETRSIDRQHDLVTGARVDLEVEVELPPERMWDLVTDVSRIGEWSPECVYGAWLGPRCGPPEVGSRFEARNQVSPEISFEVLCVVTEAERPRVFAWVVLDDEGTVEHAGSLWRYELRPGGSPGRTLVRHSFEHGTGITGLRVGVEKDPEHADEILRGRLDELRSNMSVTIAAMARS
jgi:uncharacterized protein YndB with AHSA1/START domain